MVPEEPLLPADEIQGDVLAGFRKNHETFVFVRIGDPDAARRAVRELLPLVASLDEVAMFNAVFRTARARRGEIPGALTATWLNVAFTAAGLGKLAARAEVATFADRSFRLGLAARSGFVGDPAGESEPGHPRHWHFGGPTNPVEGVVLVAGDRPEAVDAMVAEVERILTGGAPGFEVVWVERCHADPVRPGHEHFGFRDGISQPGVRGRLGDCTSLTPAGREGQVRVWPGQFVLGLERQRRSLTDPTPLPPLPVRPEWARHGSLLVIRRLRQEVERFHQFVERAAADVARVPGFADLTPGWLAAMIVGRWPSGTPLVLAPDGDDPAIGADNTFGYLHEDPDGQRCPHGAHIRKMNPRDQPPRGATAGDALTHLVLRRGLTFDHSAGRDGPAGVTDRGLMFACYQSSIRQGFEFLSAQWANNRHRPHADPGGMDLLIGRHAAAVAGHRRSLVLVGSEGQRHELTTTEEWVTPTGGGYFFTPSMPAMREVLAR